jgi:hypothetical protein
MLLSFLAVVVTGIGKFPILLRFLAKNGVYLPSSGITLIHTWGGVAMTALILVHLVLHWKWVVSVTRRFLAGKRRKSGSENTPTVE